MGKWCFLGFRDRLSLFAFSSFPLSTSPKNIKITEKRGGIRKMNELKKIAFGSLTKLNEAWITAIQEAERNGTGVDMTCAGVFSKQYDCLMSAFLDYEIRSKKKKRGLFG